jgi:toxin ParE1/3/4
LLIEWSDHAVSDLGAVLDYTEQEWGADAATRAARIVYAAVQSLRTMPYRGRPGRVEHTRELVIQGLPWIVIYSVTERRVLILNVVHGARKWP